MIRRNRKVLQQHSIWLSVLLIDHLLDIKQLICKIECGNVAMLYFSKRVHQLSYDIDHQLETRMIKFVHLCLNHCNHVCRSIISSKLHCIKSTFASNYKYLSYRYNISHSDWYKDISHLIGKVKLKFQQDFQSRDTAQTLVELCAIRDGLSTCNALSYLDACELINLISLD